jgi:integrase
MCNVSLVLARRSLGVLWPQPNIVWHPGWQRRQERAKHGREDQCQTPERAPLVLSPEQVVLGLEGLEFRDQLLVFLDGALGARRGELGGLRWVDCDFQSQTFSVRHSYYWRRGGHIKVTKTEGSAKLLPMHAALKDALLEWKSLSLYTQQGDFVFPSHRCKGRKPLDLAAVLKRKIRPAFDKVGITSVGWHTFRHTVGTMLAEMGEHQLTIRDYRVTAIFM